MHNTILAPLLGLAAFVLFKVISAFIVRQQNAAKARQLGCQEAPLFPSNDLIPRLGLSNLKQMQAADKAQLFPDALQDRQRAMSELTGRECSTFRFYALGQEIYVTTDPRNIQALLATQFQDFDLGPTRHAIMSQTLGDGIFVQDGKAWEHSRAMLRPNFVRDQISDLDLEEQHVKDLVSVLPVKSDGWTELTNIQTLFFRLTIDSATEFLFGESVHSQLTEADAANSGDRSKRNEKAFSLNFDSAQRHMAAKFRLSDMHWLYRSQEFNENNKVVNEFVQHYVDLALQKGTSSEKTAEEGTKQKYVFLDALAQQTRDPIELRSQMLNILLAGRDTTASLLSWLFHQLLRNPEIYARLRETILAEFGTYEDPRNLTFSALKSCQYLQYCINETLRLWTVVPGNARRSNKATTLPRGGGPDGQSPVFIPKDTDVGYSIHVMHRRKDLWGPDAEEFRPDRFAGKRPGWEFLPFNGGPRICIGQQFALTEASYVVVRLLQKFDRIETTESELAGPVTSNLGLTNCPARPVTLRLHEAKA